ncbi:MAG TPA: twin-arginine translocation pathway signal protein [Casimicrobiaceae bacterium]|nr:twin-arginine translocation pathway signal protein [Casimicrobiaceae bacterium]
MSDHVVPMLGATMPRRIFLQRIAAMLGGVSLPDALAAATRSCRSTAQDIIGPFYRFGAPFQTKLLGSDEPGQRLIVAGTVYGSDCRTRLANTLIEVWQANHAGQYDTDSPGNFTERNTFRLRGMMLTNQQGTYEFETVVPGRYPIPPNIPGLEKYAGVTRPAHIHFRVSDSLHVPLTTQVYFRDDPFIAKDPWAARKPSSAIGLKQEGKFLRGAFDIVLANGF